jgi:hypothetical protein
MANSDIITTRKTEVPSTFEKQNIGVRGLYLFDRIVARTVVNNNNRQVRIVALFEGL